jgi:uncharacterized membrane protein YdfJ with MMPL/SSD domain
MDRWRTTPPPSFGLSMDYQVFLLSRIRERYTETGDTTEAVVSAV